MGFTVEKLSQLSTWNAELNAEILNSTMSGIEKSRSLHNFKYRDEVHLEKKQSHFY